MNFLNKWIFMCAISISFISASQASNKAIIDDLMKPSTIPVVIMNECLDGSLERYSNDKQYIVASTNDYGRLPFFRVEVPVAGEVMKHEFTLPISVKITTQEGSILIQENTIPPVEEITSSEVIMVPFKFGMCCADGTGYQDCLLTRSFNGATSIWINVLNHPHKPHPRCSYPQTAYLNPLTDLQNLMIYKINKMISEKKLEEANIVTKLPEDLIKKLA